MSFALDTDLDLDLVLVGGGLQGALTALAVLERAPGARLALLEAGPTLGGNHTWSFHAGDLSPRMERVIAPLVARRWPAYQVAFPGLSRTFERPYASVTSARLHAAVAERLGAAPGARLLLGRRALAVEAGAVALEGGERLEARLVIDARGPASSAAGAAGFQKFLGQELRLSRPVGQAIPLVMDATVDQADGYRFVYVLPFTPDHVLVEDTFYSESPALDRAASRAAIAAWVAARGGAVAEVLREEEGVLPLPLAAGRPEAGTAPVRGGYAGGWFHPTTGYSLPCAARLAEAVADAFPAPPALGALADAHHAQARFFALLNRMLFRALPPAQRYTALERFHRLPPATVERFYALATTPGDRARVLLGRPPRGLSLSKALLALIA